MKQPPGGSVISDQSSDVFSVYNVILVYGFALAADSIPHAWRNVRQDLPEVSIKQMSFLPSGIKTFDDDDGEKAFPYLFEHCLCIFK
jgi:hypothetical protein